MRFRTLITDILQGSCHSIQYLDSNDVNQTISRRGILIRKAVSPVLKIIYRTQTSYHLVIDRRAKLKASRMGRIFVVNHRQRDDMVFSAIVAGANAFFLFGNETLIFEDLINGFGLWANGIIHLHREDKASRRAAYEKMRYILSHGGNTIIFPEGYWNLADNGQADAVHLADGHNSENWLIQDFNVGAFRLAKELQCEIVPVVLHYDEVGKKHCYAQRGEPFRVLSDDDVFTAKDAVHQQMTDMYYELMEKYSSYQRGELERDGLSLRTQWELLRDKLIGDCNIERIGYKLDLQDEKKIGKAKVVQGVVSPEEAYAFMERLTPRKENAFLWRK